MISFGRFFYGIIADSTRSAVSNEAPSKISFSIKKDEPGTTRRFVQVLLVVWVPMFLLFIFPIVFGDGPIDHPMLSMGVVGIPLLVILTVGLKLFQKWLDRFPTKK